MRAPELTLMARAAATPEAMSAEDHEFIRSVYSRGGHCSPAKLLRLKRIMRDFGVYLSGGQSVATPPMHKESFAARIHVSEALTGHREKDDAYPAIARLSTTVRVIECKNGIQWILQRRYGDQWRGIAYCRTRDALIREAKKLAPADALLALPEHHDVECAQ